MPRKFHASKMSYFKVGHLIALTWNVTLTLKESNGKNDQV